MKLKTTFTYSRNFLVETLRKADTSVNKMRIGHTSLTRQHIMQREYRAPYMRQLWYTISETHYIILVL